MAEEKPPKRKVVGVSIKRKPGEVVQQGKPAEVGMHVTRGVRTKTYKPELTETGHKAYGKPGGGTDKEMRALIDDAQTKKRDVTDYSSKGLHYKAGTTTTTETPAKFHTSINVTPKIQKVALEKKPIYEKGSASSGSNSGGKLKARAVTLGGSDKHTNPANKTGIGTPRKVKIRSVTSFKKY